MVKYENYKFAKQMKILSGGEEETPPPKSLPKGKRGRLKTSKARNLFERLLKYVVETLCFMTSPNILFTINLSEQDIRMTKVQ